MEDFETDAVSFDAGLWVGHLDDGSWLVDFFELVGGDHLVADYLIAVSDCFEI